jgi:Spy/CpxP family protein refolding chaperone
MVDQNNMTPASPDESSPTGIKRGRRGTLAIALIAVALVAGATGNLLSSAFGQGFGWRPGGWHAGAMTPAQLDDRIDRMTKHMAIELDATADQQGRIAAIAKAAVADLRPLRERAQAARAQGLALLTSPNIDRSAIERLRAEQIGLAETASKRIAQGLADAAEVLNPDQRKKVAEWFASGGPLMRWWHHG